MLTNIFTPTQCAACKLCCNFHHSSAWETPFLEPGLAERLQKFHVELFTRADGSPTFKLPFCTEDEAEVALCPMLDTEQGCRLAREERPFECRIWPLRLMRTVDGTVVLGCYMDCPALAEGDGLARLTAFAQGELLPQLISYAQSYPQIIRPYDAHYAVLCAVPEL